MKYIPITGTNKKAIVDDIDFNGISKWSWCISGCNYPYRRETFAPKQNRKLYMHRAILGKKNDLHIDHINGDPFDNRKENLRWVTRSQNIQNNTKKKPNKLGYKGVYKYSKRTGYFSRITVNKKIIYLGYFTNPIDAHDAYKNAVIKYHKEYGSRDN